MKGYQKRVICPVCRYERWVEVADHLLLRHMGQIAIISLCLMGAMFSWLEFRVFLIPLLVWGCFEVARSLLNRHRMVCGQCDFDPFLYKMSPELARARCEKRLLEIGERIGMLKKEVAEEDAGEEGHSPTEEAEATEEVEAAPDSQAETPDTEEENQENTTPNAPPPAA